MKNGFNFILLISLFSFCFIFVQAQPASLNGLDAYVEKALKDWEVPGVAIAVVKDDKIVFAKGYGVKELSDSPAMTYKRLFEAVKRNDVEAIKQMMSKTTIEFAESIAETQKRPLNEISKNGFLEANLSKTLQPVRNQRIKGNFAALEIYIPESIEQGRKIDAKWQDAPFVFEEGSWKVAVGDLFANTYKMPCRLNPSSLIDKNIPQCEPKDISQPVLQPVDEKTIFGVASNSKAFTSAALAILVDEGKLNWDDKVIKYLPEFQLYDPYVTREITIRDLLTHRSGLPAYGGDILWWGGDYSRDEIIHRVRFVKPQSSFRSRYAYQNIPFITAGKIVERVSGKTWEQFVKERIFTPLGMKDSTTSIKEFTPTTNKVTPHFRDVETGKTIPIAWRNLDNGAPAAGINSNVVDMAQWVRLQLNEDKFDGKQIISERSLAAMHTPQMLIPFSNPKDQPRLKTNFVAYGMGWNIREYAGYKMVSHGGWTDGQLTFTAMLPEKELGVVILTNIHNRNLYTPLVYRIFDAFLNDSHKTSDKSSVECEQDPGCDNFGKFYGIQSPDWSAYYLKRTKDAEKAETEAFRQKEAERVKDAKPVLPLSGYAGAYENELYGKISFAEENGKLVVRMSHSPTFIGDLEHWHFNTFRVVWRDPVAEKTFLTFTINEQGKAASVKMALDDFIDDAEYEYFRTEK